VGSDSKMSINGMWTEIYRPRTLGEMVNQTEIVNRLKGFVKNANIPNCLSIGPPGTGKTTAAHCLARDLYGDDYMDYVMELNASDERGIGTVREKVKIFARTMSLGKVSFKIVILDEVDNMTAAAQQALRAIIETNSRTCRFILLGNYGGKIIEPIQSRCTLFRFAYLKKEDQNYYLSKIIEKEHVNISEGGLEAIFDICRGDLRKALNILQSTASIKGVITADIIYTITGRVNSTEIMDLLKTALKGNFIDAEELLKEIVGKYGIDGSDLIQQIYRVVSRSSLPDSWKSELGEIMGETESRIAAGANDEVQLYCFLSRVSRIKRRKES